MIIFLQTGRHSTAAHSNISICGDRWFATGRLYQDDQDEALVAAFDVTMRDYYKAPTEGSKDTTWSEQLKPLFTSKLRPHMREFLQGKGFEMK